jgi:hypothetical protein
MEDGESITFKHMRKKDKILHQLNWRQVISYQRGKLTDELPEIGFAKLLVEDVVAFDRRFSRVGWVV